MNMQICLCFLIRQKEGGGGGIVPGTGGGGGAGVGALRCDKARYSVQGFFFAYVEQGTDSAD